AANISNRGENTQIYLKDVYARFVSSPKNIIEIILGGRFGFTNRTHSLYCSASGQTKTDSTLGIYDVTFMCVPPNLSFSSPPDIRQQVCLAVSGVDRTQNRPTI